MDVQSAFRTTRYVVDAVTNRSRHPNHEGHAVCGARFKYVRHGTGEERLFDLVADPGEMEDRHTDPACTDPLEAARDHLQTWCTTLDGDAAALA